MAVGACTMLAVCLSKGELVTDCRRFCHAPCDCRINPADTDAVRAADVQENCCRNASRDQEREDHAHARHKSGDYAEEIHGAIPHEQRISRRRCHEVEVLEDGILTDAQGRRVDFRNTVIIMTSNLGAKTIINPEGTKLGFAAGDETKNEEAENDRIRKKVMEYL